MAQPRGRQRGGRAIRALGLAALGFQVTGSDISPVAVQRAGDEAARRGIRLPCFIADVRALPVCSTTFDAVIACDNALPHLLSEDEIHQALQECLRCLRPNGRCVISMRDYEVPPSPGTVETRDYGDRTWAGRDCRLSQIWRWHGAFYDVAFELMTNDDAKEVVARTPPTTYFAIRTDRVAMLMEQAGFTWVRRSRRTRMPYARYPAPLARLVARRRPRRRGDASARLGPSTHCLRQRALASDVLRGRRGPSIVGGSAWEPTPWRAVQAARGRR